MDDALVDVLESAAKLQEWVPDATLVGGRAAALFENHRTSYDHDHVINDLRHRFDAVLDALESDPECVTNRVRPGKIILGQEGTPVADQVARQLGDPRPKDTSTISQLDNYRRLRERWRDWESLKATLQEVALHMGTQE